MKRRRGCSGAAQTQHCWPTRAEELALYRARRHRGGGSPSADAHAAAARALAAAAARSRSYVNPHQLIMAASYMEAIEALRPTGAALGPGTDGVGAFPSSLAGSCG